MKIEDLTHIFRHQTTATENFTPSDVLDYMLIDGQNKLVKHVDVSKLAELIPALEHYVFEGYKDRMPIFLKPEIHIPL
jgi:hypothetical protein